MRKEKIRIIKPLELLNENTSKSFIPRDLIPTYYHLGLVKLPDAIAMYVGAGCVEFARNKGRFFESEARISRKFQVTDNTVRAVVADLIKRKIIGREGKNGGVLEERPWFIPSLEKEIIECSTLENTTARNPCPIPQGIIAVTAGNPCGATAGNPCGHLKDSGSERKKEVKQEEVKRETPPPPNVQSSLKSKTEEGNPALKEKMAYELLDGIDLFDPDTLSKTYYGLLEKVTGCSINGNMPESDSKKAELLIAGIPKEYRSNEFLRSWLAWYVSQLSPKFRSDSHYLTRFSDSLKRFQDVYKAPEEDYPDPEIMDRLNREIVRHPEAMEIYEGIEKAYGEDNLWKNEFKLCQKLSSVAHLISTSDSSRILVAIQNAKNPSDFKSYWDSEVETMLSSAHDDP